MRKWKPSKTAAREFAQKMQEIDKFCKENNISSSRSNDSYYFELNDKFYRVSNHSIEASNAAAFDEFTGEMKRDKYHPSKRESDTVYIHASKTRIIEIYNNLKAGYELDGRGYIKNATGISDKEKQAEAFPEPEQPIESKTEKEYDK